MASQDLLYSILPRPPLAPSASEFQREVTAIVKEPVTKKTQLEKELPDQSAQDSYTPSDQHAPEDQPSLPAAEPVSAEDTEDDGHIDLFV